MSDSTQTYHHVLPLKIYLAVGAALLVFTAITVWVSQFDFGPYNLIVAMIIAAFKATLVVLFFMHLKYDNKLYMFVFVTGILFLAVFITLTMFDTQRRDYFEDIVARPINDQAIIYRQADTLEQSAIGDSAQATTDSVVSDTTGEQ